MTNGEKIKEIFPEAQIEYGESDVYIWLNHEPVNFSREAWESNYSEIPTGSTTKNDLVVDCVSRQEVDRLARIYLKEPTDNHVAFYEDFLDLPSVTPQLSSELEKNSKKLEKDFGELDCISREQAIEWVDNLRKMDECFGNHKGDYYPLSEVIDRLQNVPSVTPQKPEIVPIAEIKYDEDKLKELVNKCVLTVTPQDPSIIKIRAEIEAYANQATDEKQRIAFNSCLNLIDHYTELNPS